MLNQPKLRPWLLSTVARSVFPVAEMSAAFVRRISQPLFLPAGIYVPGPRGDRLRSLLPAPPTIPFVWGDLGGFWRSIGQQHVA
jgi:hypothetical protein